MQEREENSVNDSDGTVSKGTFLLVKLAGRKHVSHFVAEVLCVLEGEEFEVRYYKRVGRKFIIEKEDVYTISASDVVLKLPSPISVGASERQLSHISFDIDFNAYNVN
ncbi:hypothetical protein [Blattabacterium cuenoti]|uniref:hypothetical protein n=1 Tax=Blattabacterium cuenoti TaxID=1653831 RepID=UPI00311EC4E4